MGKVRRVLGRRGVLAVVICGVVALRGVHMAYSENGDSHQVVWGTYTFGKIHSVMKALQDVLGAVLSGFLTGDQEAIRLGADTLVQQLQQASGEFRTTTGEEEETIQGALHTATTQAKLMQTRAQQGDYRQAYEHFSNMVSQCVQCHQEHRLYGQFPQAASQQRGEVQMTHPRVERGN